MDCQTARQPAVPFLGVLKRHPIGPFTAEGLNEPLRLAVGSGRGGPGADVPEPQDAAGPAERFGDVGQPAARCPRRHEPCRDRLRRTALAGGSR